MKVHIGCCGFPISMKKYFEKFSTVELQSTFYNLPELKTVEKWRRIAPPNFQFTVKAFQGITHPLSSPTWKRARIKLENLKNKVGFLKPTKEVFNFWKKNLEICKVLNASICLIQLPASFKDNQQNLSNAEKFFSKIERDNINIAVELRGWSEKSIKKLCKKFNLIHCTDPFVSMPTYFGKSKIAYFRLHGSYEKGRINYKHKYSKRELEELKNKIINLKAKEVYCFLNNVWMYENAIQLQNLLKNFEK